MSAPEDLTTPLSAEAGGPPPGDAASYTPIYQDLARFRVAPGFRGRSGPQVLLWQLVQATLFRLSPQPFYGWRRFLLKLFGAKVGRGVIVRPTTRVTYPWKVSFGEHCWVGDDTEIYSLGPISIGANAVVSQRSYLCAGTHDPDDITFPLVAKPIVVEPEAWVATGCFVAPGVTIGRGAIVAAQSTVLNDVPPGYVVAGSPARVRKQRALPTRGLDATPRTGGSSDAAVVASSGQTVGRPGVVVIGQLPPPMNGFAYITHMMVAAFRRTHAVRVVDIAAPAGASGLGKHARRLARTLRACLSLLRRPSGARPICYIACEGGAGLVYTLLAVATARLCGYRRYLHHHSFAYIDAPRGLMRAVLAAGGDDLTHIFLCSIMRDRFEAAYQRIVHGEILSNAAFVPTDETPPEPRPDDALVLGHLSNLTGEKGLYLYLDLLRQALAAGFNVRGVLAGPAALAEDQAAIAAAVADLGGRLDYRGPLYGDAKSRFYRDIDVFVFPTQYVNEAQPTVLFEAQAAGCRIISFDRGCISRQLGKDDALVASSEDFCQFGLTFLATVDKKGKKDRQATFTKNRLDTLHQLGHLFDDKVFFVGGQS